MRKLTVAILLLLVCAVSLPAQEAMTNDTIVKLVKAGLSEDVILGMIRSQPGKYSTKPEDIIALKGAGVSDKAISAMIEKTQAPAAPKAPDLFTAPAPAPVPAASAAPAEPAAAAVNEVGVYYKKNDQWMELLPEVVNWKTGGVLKTFATAGIVKGDVNGRINGGASRNSVRSPVEFLIYMPEGTAITEYQLIRLRTSKDAREFRTVTGGVMHVSGGATRDLVEFEGKKIAPRTYVIALPRLGAGQYGFLPPGAVTSSHASATLGKMYTFHLLE